jgi:hypothetical protein
VIKPTPMGLLNAERERKANADMITARIGKEIITELSRTNLLLPKSSRKRAFGHRNGLLETLGTFFRVRCRTFAYYFVN